MNEAANEVPPILPHMLLKLRGKDFAKVLQKQKECLLKRWTEVESDAVAIPPQKGFKELN